MNTNPRPETRHQRPAQLPGLTPAWTVLLYVFYTLLAVLLLFKLCTGGFNSRLLFVGLLYAVLSLIGLASVCAVLFQLHEACRPPVHDEEEE